MRAGVHFTILTLLIVALPVWNCSPSSKHYKPNPFPPLIPSSTSRTTQRLASWSDWKQMCDVTSLRTKLHEVNPFGQSHPTPSARDYALQAALSRPAKKSDRNVDTHRNVTYIFRNRPLLIYRQNYRSLATVRAHMWCAGWRTGPTRGGRSICVTVHRRYTWTPITRTASGPSRRRGRTPKTSSSIRIPMRLSLASRSKSICWGNLAITSSTSWFLARFSLRSLSWWDHKQPAWSLSWIIPKLRHPTPNSHTTVGC